MFLNTFHLFLNLMFTCFWMFFSLSQTFWGLFEDLCLRTFFWTMFVWTMLVGTLFFDLFVSTFVFFFNILFEPFCLNLVFNHFLWTCQKNTFFCGSSKSWTTLRQPFTLIHRVHVIRGKGCCYWSARLGYSCGLLCRSGSHCRVCELASRVFELCRFLSWWTKHTVVGCRLQHLRLERGHRPPGGIGRKLCEVWPGGRAVGVVRHLRPGSLGLGFRAPILRRKREDGPRIHRTCLRSNGEDVHLGTDVGSHFLNEDHSGVVRRVSRLVPDPRDEPVCIVCGDPRPHLCVHCCRRPSSRHVHRGLSGIGVGGWVRGAHYLCYGQGWWMGRVAAGSGCVLLDALETPSGSRLSVAWLWCDADQRHLVLVLWPGDRPTSSRYRWGEWGPERHRASGGSKNLANVPHVFARSVGLCIVSRWGGYWLGRVFRHSCEERSSLWVDRRDARCDGEQLHECPGLKFQSVQYHFHFGCLQGVLSGFLGGTIGSSRSVVDGLRCDLLCVVGATNIHHRWHNVRLHYGCFRHLVAFHCCGLCSRSRLGSRWCDECSCYSCGWQFDRSRVLHRQHSARKFVSVWGVQSHAGLELSSLCLDALLRVRFPDVCLHCRPGEVANEWKRSFVGRASQRCDNQQSLPPELVRSRYRHLFRRDHLHRDTAVDSAFDYLGRVSSGIFSKWFVRWLLLSMKCMAFSTFSNLLCLDFFCGVRCLFEPFFVWGQFLLELFVFTFCF